jgi:hypothetical protein
MEDFPEEVRPRRPVQPPWLSLYIQCKRFNCLLVEGGLLDQPVEAWQSVMAAGETYESWLSERREQQSNVEMTDALLRKSLGMG